MIIFISFSLASIISSPHIHLLDSCKPTRVCDTAGWLLHVLASLFFLTNQSCWAFISLACGLRLGNFPLDGVGSYLSFLSQGLSWFHWLDSRMHCWTEKNNPVNSWPVHFCGCRRSFVDIRTKQIFFTHILHIYSHNWTTVSQIVTGRRRKRCQEPRSVQSRGRRWPRAGWRVVAARGRMDCTG